MWLLFATAYICLDYLFLFCAFFQTNKLLRHFQKLDLQFDAKSDQSEEFSRDINFENSEQGSIRESQNNFVQKKKDFASHFNLTFVRTILEIYVFRIIRFWPALMFVFFIV